MIPSQMLKGIIDGCILKVISKKETYGYEISEELRNFGFFDISEGTIYPLLLRLEKNELITSEYKESQIGPKRKYFSITSNGLEELDDFYNNWKELSYGVNKLFKKEISNE